MYLPQHVRVTDMNHRGFNNAEAMYCTHDEHRGKPVVPEGCYSIQGKCSNCNTYDVIFIPKKKTISWHSSEICNNCECHQLKVFHGKI